MCKTHEGDVTGSSCSVSHRRQNLEIWKTVFLKGEKICYKMAY